MQPAEAVVVNGGKGEGRSQCIYIIILELFLHMTMLSEAVPVYTKATSLFLVTAKAYLSEIHITV